MCSSSRQIIDLIHPRPGERRRRKKRRSRKLAKRGGKKEKKHARFSRRDTGTRWITRRGGLGHVNEFASFHGRMGFPCRWIQWPRRHNRVSLERHGRLKIRRREGGRGIGGRREDGGEKTSKIRGRALSPRRRGTLPIGFLFFSSSSSSFLKRLYVESWKQTSCLFFLKIAF